MKRKMSLFSAGILITAACMATGASAQESTPTVGLKQDWYISEASNPKECFIISQPVSSEVRQNNKPVTARRSAIRFFVSNRPSQNVKQEPSFTGGYPFRQNSTVSVKIGSETFELYTEGEYAWPEPKDDTRIISAMKRGSKAVVTGLSSRGRTTIDTFSLLGFTAALDEANKRCGSSS